MLFLEFSREASQADLSSFPTSLQQVFFCIQPEEVLLLGSSPVQRCSQQSIFLQAPFLYLQNFTVLIWPQNVIMPPTPGQQQLPNAASEIMLSLFSLQNQTSLLNTWLLLNTINAVSVLLTRPCQQSCKRKAIYLLNM